jgi:hypothetical protein
MWQISSISRKVLAAFAIDRKALNFIAVIGLDGMSVAWILTIYGRVRVLKTLS